MHQIAMQLPDYECWFSQLFADSAFVKAVLKHTRLLDNTVLAGQFKAKSEEYLRANKLNIDYGAKKNRYDLVVICSDMIVARSLRQYKIVWVQEGMIDPPTTFSKIIKTLGLPANLAGNTSLNGATDICDIYCAASHGYREHFIKGGTKAEKLIVTGMPNYDNCQQFLNNTFPHHNYVMVATTDMRETFRKEDRPAFIKECVKIAAGRQLLFKLHPNEKYDRALAEIREFAPADALVFQAGNTSEMIANCTELVTQYSTVVYTGIALGKKVHSYFNLDELMRQTPIQNHGTSAKNIANICRAYEQFDGSGNAFLSQYQYKPATIEIPEEIYA